MIYASVSRLNCCNNLSCYRVNLASERKKERSQKIDNLPVLATCQSGTVAMLSCKVNGPIVQWKHLVMPDMAHRGL